MPVSWRRGAILGLLVLVGLIAACRGVGENHQAISRSDRQRVAPTPVPATLVLPADAVRQGGAIDVQATGFAPHEPVVITATGRPHGQLQKVFQLTADWRGQIGKQNLTLPEWLTSGVYTVVASGTRSQRQATATLAVRARDRWIKLDRYTVRPAEKLGFIAGGFVPGEMVQVAFEEAQQPVARLKTDPAGNTAWSEIVVPILRPGRHTLRLIGREGTLDQPIAIEPFRPSLELSPWSGPPGRQVDLNARGFMPGETVRIFVGGDSQSVLALQADQWGNFWGVGPVPIPVDRAGQRVTIAAVGERSGARAEASFAVYSGQPWGELSTYAGMPGSSVMFSGGGFAAREQVVIHVGSRSGPVVAVGQTDENGRFWGAGPAAIPIDAEHDVTYVFIGKQSGAEATATFKLISIPLPESPQP